MKPRSTWPGALLAVALLLLAAVSRADDGPPPPESAIQQQTLSDAQETRYRSLLQVLRCLVCQNESLMDSDAPLAADLRAKVRERVAKGESDAEIKKYLTDRYGDFVLYQPPFQVNTLLLWCGPFALALVGLTVLFAFSRRSKRHPVQRAVDGEALQRLLDEGK